MNAASAIYVGQVRHRRYEPVEHSFRYRLFLVYLDLDEVPELFARHPGLSTSFAPAWLRRRDHLGDPGTPLAESVRQLVHQETGARPRGPIRLLTHLRYFGYCFNPVSFYYCFDPAGERVETIVAQVQNTPWGEMRPYVLAVPGGRKGAKKMRFRFAKDFHVSPFMPMDIDYDWRFTAPGSTLAVHMENLREGRRVFDATLTLKRREFTRSALLATLCRYPLMTAKVSLAIYWQALRLWWKRIPFHPHPKHLISEESDHGHAAPARPSRVSHAPTPLPPDSLDPVRRSRSTPGAGVGSSDDPGGR